MGVGFWKEIKNIYKSGLVQDLEIYQPLVKDLSDRYQKQMDQPENQPFTKNNQEPLEQPVVGVGLCSVEQHSKIQTLKSPAEEVSQE